MDDSKISLSDELELLATDDHGGTFRKRLTPGEALDFAEDLIRRGTRRMMFEETRALTERTVGGPAR